MVPFKSMLPTYWRSNAAKFSDLWKCGSNRLKNRNQTGDGWNKLFLWQLLTFSVATNSQKSFFLDYPRLLSNRIETKSDHLYLPCWVKIFHVSESSATCQICDFGRTSLSSLTNRTIQLHNLFFKGEFYF